MINFRLKHIGPCDFTANIGDKKFVRRFKTYEDGEKFCMFLSSIIEYMEGNEITLSEITLSTFSYTDTGIYGLIAKASFNDYSYDCGSKEDAEEMKKFIIALLSADAQNTETEEPLAFASKIIGYENQNA